MDIRTKFLAEISGKPRLTKAYFLKLYAIELTWPGFEEEALSKLECAGCSRAREYYQRFVDEYEKEHDEMMKRVAEWHRKETDKKGSESVWERQQEVEQLTKKSQLLKQKLRLLKQKKIEQEQLVTMESQDL